MYIVEAQVKRASEGDETVGRWRGTGAEERRGLERWGGTYCEFNGMRRSEKAKVLEKA